MALAIAPWENRNEWWNRRARQNAGLSPEDFRQSRISLEDAIRQAKPNNNGHGTGMIYLVLPEALAFSQTTNHAMSPAKQHYGNNAANIEAVVEKEQEALGGALGYFRKGIKSGVNYIGDGLGKAVSLIPEPARNAVGAGLSYVSNELVMAHTAATGIAIKSLRYASNGLGKAVSWIPKPIRYAAAPALIALAAACTPTVQAGVDFRIVEDYVIIEQDINVAGSSRVEAKVEYSSSSALPNNRFDEVRIELTNKSTNQKYNSGAIDLTDLKPNQTRTISAEFERLPEGKYRASVQLVNYRDVNLSNNSADAIATPTVAKPTVTASATATPSPTPTATPVQKSIYELALERLNPQISQTARDFVRNLAAYNSSIGNREELHNTYAGLERIVDVVEKHPKIVNGLNMFGSDALALLLADNSGIVDMGKYWFLTNGTALQAQDFFYAADEIFANGDYKEKMKGPLTNKQFDKKEREIANFRLRKQIEWQGKWSTPLEYEEAVREYGSEQRASNALRWRVLPYRIFFDDIVKGELHPSKSTFDTDAWLVVASYNNEHSEEVRAEILARLNDPERYARDVEKTINFWGGGLERDPKFGGIAKKALEYYNIIALEGTPYEKAALALINHAEEIADHDNATSLFALWSPLVGASGGTTAAQIIHPEGYITWDTQFGFTISAATEKKLKDVFVYRIDGLSQLMPLSEKDIKNPMYLSLDGIFSIYSNILALRENGAKILAAESASGTYVRIPLTK